MAKTTSDKDKGRAEARVDTNRGGQGRAEGRDGKGVATYTEAEIPSPQESSKQQGTGGRCSDGRLGISAQTRPPVFWGTQ